ncbi:MAG: HAMP domain-containing histidine kinase [Deltaproteobacteria bacterium]|nr:HAMP domain-containing histidine kinase [Deltaproteobacteria bacterium]
MDAQATPGHDPTAPAVDHDEKFADIGRMLVGVLHDFKFPLHVISTAAYLLSKSDKIEKKQKYFQQIEDHVLMFNRMIQNILDYSKGKSCILPLYAHSDEFISNLKTNLYCRFAEHSVKVTIRDDYQGKIFMDGAQVTRVLYNLIENAAQAMGYKGEIDVVLAKEDDLVRFKISDNGPGVSEAIKDKMFTAFATHGKKEGTGLGLALCKNIIEEHGGTISFESREGGGTVFIVSLPVK